VRDRASDHGGTRFFWRIIHILGHGHVMWRCVTVVNPLEAREGNLRQRKYPAVLGGLRLFLELLYGREIWYESKHLLGKRLGDGDGF